VIETHIGKMQYARSAGSAKAKCLVDREKKREKERIRSVVTSG